MSNLYDVIIIGGGPAGLSAGLYAGRAKMKTLMLEGGKVGGQIVITHLIENYPGSISEETGPSLIERMEKQFLSFGGELKREQVIGVDFSGKVKKVKTDGGEYEAKAIIIATGAKPRPLGLSNEQEYSGKGISYCATCDASFFEDFEVFVIGGGDTAVEESLYIAKFARKVTIVHRRDELRAAKSIVEKAMANEKIHFIWDSVVDSIGGDGIVSEMTLRNVKTGELTKIEADENDGMFGLFVMVGYLPQTDVFEGIIDRNEGNYIIAGEDLKTNVEGVFAAGDCRTKALRQVVTATSDGAVAAVNVERYIGEHFPE